MGQDSPHACLLALDAGSSFVIFRRPVPNEVVPVLVAPTRVVGSRGGIRRSFPGNEDMVGGAVGVARCLPAGKDLLAP
jgi:hypothetical protein